MISDKPRKGKSGKNDVSPKKDFNMHKTSFSVILSTFLFFSLVSAACRPQKAQDLSQFLKETEHLDYNNPVFSDITAKVVTDDMPLAHKLEKFFYFTRDTITFVPSASLTASGALREMKAVCYTKAMIYVSFCRRLGVPANVALVEFIIKARPGKIASGHGIAKIFYNGKWIYIDTVSNREAWSWWDKANAHLFEPPVFSLEKNVLVDGRFVSNVTLKDFETNDVPEKWLKSLQDFLDTGKY